MMQLYGGSHASGKADWFFKGPQLELSLNSTNTIPEIALYLDRKGV